uniref:Uncharacterized protein n=1 Tax=Candidatus Kentrum sp. TC TaxID=2126339 RepID=A0A450ZHL3_9GAMM|nr:MAG: hypothetical protein BECKTC1821F_GA0114240_100284 [Candidatus Kentron sp. TC]
MNGRGKHERRCALDSHPFPIESTFRARQDPLDPSRWIAKKFGCHAWRVSRNTSSPTNRRIIGDGAATGVVGDSNSKGGLSHGCHLTGSSIPRALREVLERPVSLPKKEYSRRSTGYGWIAVVFPGGARLVASGRYATAIRIFTHHFIGSFHGPRRTYQRSAPGFKRGVPCAGADYVRSRAEHAPGV